ncbi:hypothetical protein SADUNF_Sadunf04G0047900 [Salix dunnii]|uniref:Uncharacterized protein n=1 Tax=Salix dunnii TaxID=1413687 RepID=A0A835K608_9ROSI|nr:hypothetical protein SADUNF_Sadunf04G0047900 [Salix dunnii]
MENSGPLHEIRFPYKIWSHDNSTRDQGPICFFFSGDKVPRTPKQRAFSGTDLDTEFIITMNTIPFHSSLLLLPSVSSSIQKPQWKAQRLLWSSSKEPAKIAKHNQKMTARTGAIAESLILGVASEPRPRDVSVLLQTGAVLLLAYGIANFIFPAFISTYYEFDKVSEDKEPNEVANSSDEVADSSDDEADPSDDD